MSVTVSGSHGHHEIVVHAAGDFSLALHHASLALAADPAISSEIKAIATVLSDTIAAGGSIVKLEIGSAAHGTVEAASGNVSLLGSHSVANFGSLPAAATSGSGSAIDTIFGGVASQLTISDFGSSLAKALTPLDTTSQIGVHSVSGGISITLGNNATITVLDISHLSPHTIKLD